MTLPLPRACMKRRAVLSAAPWAAGLAGVARAADPAPASFVDDGLVEQFFGRAATLSPRVRLLMPAVFINGYSVPMSLAVDSAMDAADMVRSVQVLAPKNPIVPVARFQFTLQSGRVAVSTRIRLAEPQTVLAVAEMGDGALLMARTWVSVDTNGCN